MRRKCIVCGRPIRRIVTLWEIRDPHPGHAPHDGAIKSGMLAPKPEGLIEFDRWVKAIYTASKPIARSDLQRWTNEQIIHHRKRADGSIRTFSTWDGERYADKYFCTDRCAVAQGHAAAHHGYRFVWRDQ